MNEALGIALGLLSGAALGALFFGGLWWTIRKGSSSDRSALWFFGSLMIRTGLTLAGFYFVGRGHWERLLACVLGFIVARYIVIQATNAAGKSHSPEGEARHAP
jgi:F1F0 ATPase subunit 2